MSERRSVWLTDDRPRYEGLDDRVTTDVVVVGAGITGLTAALLLQRQGRQVVVVEAHQVGSGTTGGTTGKLTSQHSLIYHELVRAHGTEVAQTYARVNQAAIDTVADLVAETSAECGFTRASAFVYAVDEGDLPSLVQEHEAASRLGLPSRLSVPPDVPFDVAGALEFSDQAYFHPVRYCDALAREFVRIGGRVFEGTRIRQLTEDRTGVQVANGTGVVAASKAVIATLLPFVDRGAFFARARPSRSYGVAALLRSTPPAGMYISAGSPVRSFRPWPEGGETGIIFVGEGHETGDAAATPARWGELERWAREQFEVDSFEYRWSAQDYRTVDGLPYIGPSPLTRHTYVATGFRKWGLTNGTAAAKLLSDLILGRDDPATGIFAATRFGGPTAIGRMVRDNLKVGWYLVGDFVGRLSAPPLTDLGPGEGGLVDFADQTVAAYRHPSGEVTMVSPTCTHLGCTVHWNDAENTWDCPCHDSRLEIDGSVINGP
ncbi:MAG TPA: FAD-dependent oxidoreductase, partial [Acidimicrobiia bacterium]|nr:FAD-dependent oxidoreductase [Acidimicrobiia bacterium]